ncbi:MAG: hypothetical protein AAFX02_06460, partial [Pseudomonadota bacterium]
MTDTLATAARMIYASICAYKIHEKGWERGDDDPVPTRTVQGPDDAYFYDVIKEYQDKVGFVQTVDEGYTPLFLASGNDLINAVLVGALKDGKMVVSLRGTLPPTLDNDDIIEWIKDWAQDADIPPMHWPYLDSVGGQPVNVESGFGDACTSLWPHLKGMIQDVITAHSPSGVIVTGHSKGAAMTFLIATMVAKEFPQFKDSIEVHAFAAPVTGDDGFQAAYNAAGLDETTHRYQVEYDVVPFVPLWKGADIYTEINYDPPGKKGIWGWIKSWFEESAWKALGKFITSKTKGGYVAVGDFTYFNSDHKLVPGAVVQDTALVAVAGALEDFEIGKVGGAHSAD